MDYVRVKTSQHDLIKKLKGWERKVEIASLQAQRMRNLWQQMSVEAETERTKRMSIAVKQIKRPEESLPNMTIGV